MLGKVAIIGGNGFVGGRLIQHLARSGVEALGVVRSAAGAETVRRLGGIPCRVESLEREGLAAFRDALPGSAGLVYTASVRASAADPDRTNPAGLRNVLEAARSAGVPKVAILSGLGIAHYGMNPHCTNPYFLAKMAGEVEAFRSGIPATVFRPSYIFGPGDAFLTPLMKRLATEPALEIPGDGSYRMQPVSVGDTARAILSALRSAEAGPRVVDLVGPEVLSYRALIERVARSLNRVVAIRERPVDEAVAMARDADYQGMTSHDLACLLCDEVSDPAFVEALLPEALESVDQMIAETWAGIGSVT